MAHACCMKPYNRIYYHLLAVRYANLIQCLRLMHAQRKMLGSLRSCQTAGQSETHQYMQITQKTLPVANNCLNKFKQFPGTRSQAGHLIFTTQNWIIWAPILHQFWTFFCTLCRQCGRRMVLPSTRGCDLAKKLMLRVALASVMAI